MRTSLFDTCSLSFCNSKRIFSIPDRASSSFFLSPSRSLSSCSENNHAVGLGKARDRDQASLTELKCSRMMLLLLHLDSDRVFLETGFLFRYAGLFRYGYQPLVEKKELNGTTDLEFFDLAFLIILELCHVTFKILTFHLRSGLLIFRSLYGGL